MAAALVSLGERGRSCDGARFAYTDSVQPAFCVDDPDRSAVEVKKKGIQFTGDIAEYPGTRWAHFLDLEGNQLELKKFRRIRIHLLRNLLPM